MHEQIAPLYSDKRRPGIETRFVVGLLLLKHIYDTRDLKRVTVDTTVQPKAITFPTDAKLLHAAMKASTGCANTV
jgi:hypothetical protein